MDSSPFLVMEFLVSTVNALKDGGSPRSLNSTDLLAIETPISFR